MKTPAYLKYVMWSDEDQAYLGRCPDLFFGGIHGEDEVEVYRELCQLVETEIAFLRAENRPFPPVRTRLETDSAAAAA